MIRAMSSPNLDRAYAHCREIVSARAKNFLFAFLLLPRDKRRGLEAVYAYCRLADDLADDDGIAPDERARRLADLRLRLRLALPAPGDEPTAAPAPDPELDLLIDALRDTAHRYGVRRDDLDLVAVGCEQDLTVARYATFQETYDYCYMVASAVGLACLEVFGYRDDVETLRPLAVDLGIAMQLTNILRDVREDIERDRIYLPLEDLERFGVSEDQLREGRVDQNLRDLLAFEAARAREYFARGKRLAPRVRRDARICPLALAAIYEALLDQVERNRFVVFSQRASLSTRRKVGLLGKSCGRALLPGALL